jgi:exodeoxyribonuclease V beta subunit
MSRVSDPVAFSVTGPLPAAGITVLEASAGTGKTYTIAALAARYVAQGLPLERLLLVTFTRMATGELRERVRSRLVSVEQGLGRALAGGRGCGRELAGEQALGRAPASAPAIAPAIDADPIVELLTHGAQDEVRLCRVRLQRALAEFDAATIATTHGFCQEVLGGLGIAADLAPDTTFAEDLSDLVSDVVDDLYVRRFRTAARPPLTRAQAAAIAKIAIANPAARIAPAAGEVPAMRVRLAGAVRAEVEARKRRSAVMTYDDLLTRLDAALERDQGHTAARLRTRYEVVLVDEFQDTDPVQWDIIRKGFGETGGTLVLIADPKQAIYAFRGADVYAYLEAADEAGERATLDVNWRSDQGLIDAYDALLTGAKLGHEGIVYRQVRAADSHQDSGLRGAPGAAPMRVRVVPRELVELTYAGFAAAKSAREHVAKDLADDVVSLLSSRAQVQARAGLDARRWRALRPADVAVLVQTNRTAAQIREALDRAGVPAVINGAGSVFATETAREWLRLLEALERPASTIRAHTAALTCFLGWSAERVAQADEDAWADVHRRLHDWARVLRERGMASLTETVTLAEHLPRRILAEVDGERRLTDLRHVAQLLHAAASTEQLGVTALTAWLRRRIAEAIDDTADEERSRRLESDEQAVQVLTIHRSKGLEFPVVYLPFLWESGYTPPGEPVFFHDREAGDRRTIDVATDGPQFRAHEQQYIGERRGEDLRLAYVGLTRARHQAVIWWAGSKDSRNSPLSRLLFSRDADGNVAPYGKHTPSDAAALERFQALGGEAPGQISVERSTLRAPAHWSSTLSEPRRLDHAAFGRRLDWSWRRTSYTDITADAYEAAVESEPEEALVGDEPEPEAGSAVVVDSPAGTAPSLLAQMPAGTQVGTLVHRMLANTDFAAADLDAALAEQLQAAQSWRMVELGDPRVVVAGLRAAIETPLGRVVGGIRLRDVAAADRLDELEFEMPLVGGDEPTGTLTLELIGELLRRYLPLDDPFFGYGDRLSDESLRHHVHGYLTGSLDLVVRVSGEGGPRFAVIDYKTNWLAATEEELTVWHHRPAAVVEEMLRRHYALQALLYTVALHRYLRWRLPGYEPDRHLAGVLYLFLRGMAGPQTPVVDGTPYGVFAWRPSGALVAALSDALDRGAAGL